MLFECIYMVFLFVEGIFDYVMVFGNGYVIDDDIFFIFEFICVVFMCLIEGICISCMYLGLKFIFFGYVGGSEVSYVWMMVCVVLVLGVFKLDIILLEIVKDIWEEVC